MKEAYAEDYTQQIPIFIYSKDEVVQPVYPQLERAIEKTSMVVDRHSMDISGKEYCNWIDDTWLVMAEAQFLKGEYIQAKQIFDFTKRKYPEPSTKQISYLYLGRIYMEQEEYQRAGDQFRKLSLADGFPEKMLDELITIGNRNGVRFQAKQYKKSKELLAFLLKAQIARDIYNDDAFYKVFNNTNEIYREALRLFDNTDALLSKPNGSLLQTK